MCGIFGYIGDEDVLKTTLDGLKKLEYRGYDSAGIAGFEKGKLVHFKEVGKISNVEQALNRSSWDLNLAISHTRWATHGKPSKQNAHPHFDEKKQLAVVHNGIIENHDALKKVLKSKGHTFHTETDTEVIAQLISSLYENDIIQAVRLALPLLHGTFAICLIHQDFPDQIIAYAKDAPLCIGLGNHESFVSSDPNAFNARVKEVIYLQEKEIAVIQKDSVEILDENNVKIDKKTEEIVCRIEAVSKGDYQHFTLKEIFEQPQTIRNVIFDRYIKEYGTASLELDFDVNELANVERILILGCGSSYHAGLVGSLLLQDMARIPVTVEISSEFRYSNPIISPGTFVIAISQSGETADTIAAMRELKTKGAKILSLVNVPGSTIARDSDSYLLLRAGPEIGVCSTKAFTNQVALLALFSLMMARLRHMNKEQGIAFIEAVENLPAQVEEVLSQAEHIRAIAKKYASYDNFFFLGRRYMYPTCLEGALKLKEISYINANGYPAGEMKHGPIALISEQVPTIAFCANSQTYQKIVSNLMEVKARGGKVVAIAEVANGEVKEIADDLITIPDTIDALTVITSSVASQLFAYFVALERGEDIDQPRNLAKSVTVE